MQPHHQDARRFWPWVAAIVVALLALAVPVVWLPGTSEARAAARASEYRSALFGLRQELVDTQRVLLVLTEPGSGPEAFDELLPSLSRLQEWARVAKRMAAEPLPRAWPLAPSAPLQSLRPARDVLAASADEAEAVVSDLADVLNYRTVFVEILDVAALPLTPPRNFRRFKGRLADVLAAEEASLSALPRPDLLRNHASQVRDAVARLDDWGDEYVNALWIGDTPTAAALLNELRSDRHRLEIDLEAELSAIRVAVDTRILVLAGELETALAALDDAAAGPG